MGGVGRPRLLKARNAQLAALKMLVDPGLPAGPQRVVLHNTLYCNLSCPHCESHGTLERRTARNVPASVMPLDLHRKAAEDLLPAATEVSLTLAGEPLADPLLEERLESLRRFGVRLSLTTNGLLLDPKRIALLLATGNAHINLSVDAATPFLFARLRRGGTLPRWVRRVRTLVRAIDLYGTGDFGLALSATAMGSNLRELPALVRLAARLGVRCVEFSPVFAFYEYTRGETLPHHARAYAESLARAREVGIAHAVDVRVTGGTPAEGPPEESSADGLLVTDWPADYESQLREADAGSGPGFEEDIEEEAAAAVRLARALASHAPEAPPEPAAALAAEGRLWEALRTHQATLLGFTPDAAEEVPHCRFLAGSAYVYHDGTLVPCCIHGAPALGSLRGQSGLEAWNSGAYREFRQRFLGDDPPGVCQGCPHLERKRPWDILAAAGLTGLVTALRWLGPPPWSVGEEALHNATGKVLEIRAGALSGYLERVQPEPDGTWVDGWTADPRQQAPAACVVVVGDGAVLQVAEPGRHRPDLEGSWPPAVAGGAGFRVCVGVEHALRPEQARVLSVARDGVACWLPWWEPPAGG